MNVTSAPFSTISFLGIKIYQASLNETLDWMAYCIEQDRRPRFLCTLNAALLVWSKREPFLKKTYQEADLAVIDSMVVYYALKLLGTPVPEALEAWQIMIAFIRKNYRKNYRFYFLGAEQKILEKAMDHLRKRYSDIQIAGYQHGYFKPEEEEKIIQTIIQSKPDCLFVAMSSPLKEKFLKKHQAIMNIPISLGIGGGLDILAGRYRQAPRWLHKLGLAWFFRLLMEPKRMWKRYLITNTLFCCFFLKALFKRCLPNIRSLRK